MTRLQIPDTLEVAAATSVGRQRMVNEDDYLLIVPGSPADVQRVGCIFAIADGMGGVAGGAEASRAALLAFGAAMAASDAGADRADRLREAFDAASERLHVLAAETAAHADMGTTLTALILDGGDRVWIGHVGDTRCLRIRRGELEQLTQDHAMREPRNLLTRAIGAGQRHEEADVIATDVRPADVFVLCSDGVWSIVADDEILAELRAGDLQAGAERLIERCCERGAPDNVTVVAVRVLGLGAGELRPVEISSRETRVAIGLASADRGTPRLHRWPYALLLVSAVLGLLAWLRFAHGVDLLRGWIR